METPWESQSGTPKSSSGKQVAREAGVGYLDLSPRAVKAEQVARGGDFGLRPSEQGCPRSHLPGLQVLGGLQSWKGKMARDRDEAHTHSLAPAVAQPHTAPAGPVVKVMLAGEVKFGPRRPRTVAV